jgi:hypothetical protein
VKIIQGSASPPGENSFLEPAFTSGLPVYYLLTQCPQNNSGFSFPYQIEGITFKQGMCMITNMKLHQKELLCMHTVIL